ncbi:MAG TPA: thiosulfate oxidation carrier complex protein SoxZ [Geminicoccaceae bacterium]|nr:thiosulfate oxidation carrier complex protein SoxZ [Geminicoccus sp.]HMU48958.1 thiosulfate oxidation carrier complex protein SoxZ [Geminicoccaceae bacterium]
MTRAMLNVPRTARPGEIVEIKAMIAHPMETGYRVGPNGQPIPRQIINRLVCSYDGETVFEAELFPAIAANPFVAFTTVATRSGTIRLAWTDDEGRTEIASAEITVG